MHYLAYRKLRQSWRTAVWAALNGKLPKTPMTPAFLVVHRYCPSEGLDWDNAYGGLKVMQDCLVSASPRNPDGLGLILDDSPKHMPAPPLLIQHKCRKGEARTECLVMPYHEVTPELITALWFTPPVGFSAGDPASSSRGLPEKAPARQLAPRATRQAQKVTGGLGC